MIGRRDGAQPCPITGCPEVLRRTSDIICDEKLAAKLGGVPSHVAAVWVLGDELRLDPPGAAGSSGVATATESDVVDLT